MSYESNVCVCVESVCLLWTVVTILISFKPRLSLLVGISHVPNVSLVLIFHQMVRSPRECQLQWNIIPFRWVFFPRSLILGIDKYSILRISDCVRSNENHQNADDRRKKRLNLQMAVDNFHSTNHTNRIQTPNLFIEFDFIDATFEVYQFISLC